MYIRSGLLVGMAVLASLIAATDTVAQDARSEGERCTCYRLGPGDGEIFSAPGARAFRFPSRARLGVVLAADSGDAGARIREVVKDGPAEKAGLREGDVITHIDGKSVTEARGGAVAGVLGLLSDTEPGDTVRVDYRRGREPRSARVVTDENTRMLVHSFGGDLDAVLPRTLERFRADGHSFPGGVRVFAPGMLGRHGLRLEKMNSGLEPYFGTSEGVVVLEVGKNSALGLQAGDVILRVGGRSADDPSRVRELLGTYRRGEDIAIEIIRQKRRMTVNGKLD